MNTARFRHPLHRQLKLLPWYVNSTLEPKEARKMAAHVNECAICQREVGALVKIFSARAKTMPKYSVNESKLDDLFSRIDQYEGEKRRAARSRPSERSSLREFLATGIIGWLGARPVLVAGALAAVFLGIVAIPVLRAPETESPYRVLNSEKSPGAADELRVKLRFQSAPSANTVEQLVQSGLTQQKLTARYHIERRANGEYVVTFEKRPEFAALSRLLETWRTSPGVADVAIDGG